MLRLDPSLAACRLERQRTGDNQSLRLSHWPIGFSQDLASLWSGLGLTLVCNRQHSNRYSFLADGALSTARVLTPPAHNAN